MEKSCFVRNCFAWCLEHQAISTEDDGEEVISTRIVDKDEAGNIQERVEQEIQRKCRHRRETPEDIGGCDVVVSGWH